MRRLAGITAKVKGSQYDGAMIIKAVWQKENSPDNKEPIIIKENKKILVCKAIYGGESLIITMLLSHKVPEYSFEDSKIDNKMDKIDNKMDKIDKNTDLWQVFDEKRITDFITEAGDTNPIHKIKNPVVPGLLLMEEIKKSLPVSVCRLELSFRNAVFADENLNLKIIGNNIKLYGREEFITGKFS